MTDKTDVIKENSDIFMITDAKNSNPNGSPENDNKPRMDPATNTALIRDARINRYIREYAEMFYDLPIFIQEATKREVMHKHGIYTRSEEERESATELLKETFFDNRLFGVTTAIKAVNAKGKDKELAVNTSWTGPVQFNHSDSLHPVTINEEDSRITSITRSVKEDGEAKDGGSMGRDYIVRYGVFGISGTVSAHRAAISKMTEGDLEVLDEACVRAMTMLPTHTKKGQSTRLYMRIQYKDAFTFINEDFNSYLDMIPNEEGKNLKDIRSRKEYKIDITNFIDKKLTEIQPNIETIYLYQDSTLNLMYRGKERTLTDIDLKELLEDMSINVVTIEKYGK